MGELSHKGLPGSSVQGILDQTQVADNSDVFRDSGMLRNTTDGQPVAPPAGFICGLILLVELATAWTTAGGVLKMEDRGRNPADLIRLQSDSPRNYSKQDGSNPAAADASGDGAVEGGRSETSVERLMTGVWEDDYKGHRTLTLRLDGSGSMVVELDGLAATLFAAKLTFTEEWSVSDGKVTMRATGGEPAGKVRLILSLHGDRSTQKIVEVTDDRMILVEEPSGTRFEWRRVLSSESLSD